MGACFFKQTHSVQLFIYIDLLSVIYFLLTPVLLWLLLDIHLPVNAGIYTDVCAIRALIVDFKTIALWF